jgi:hypothetical protein
VRGGRRRHPQAGGGRVVLVALVPFLIGAVLTAIGTLSAAATAIVAPIALGLTTAAGGCAAHPGGRPRG